MPVALDEAEQLVTEHEWRALLGRHSEESFGDLPVGPADTDFQHSNRHLAGERTHIRDFGDPRRARPPWLCDERLHGRDCTSVGPVSEAAVAARQRRDLRQDGPMRLEQALTQVRFVIENAAGPVSVFVADDHGELVAAATMDGAAPDTRLNAQRKAYTAARSDARSTAELAEKAREDAAERASFDPFFTFFQGGVAVFDGGRRVGAVGVSGLPGPDDDALARNAIEASGLSTVEG